jgi:hypothetical protein
MCTYVKLSNLRNHQCGSEKKKRKETIRAAWMYLTCLVNAYEFSKSPLYFSSFPNRKKVATTAPLMHGSSLAAGEKGCCATMGYSN